MALGPVGFGGAATGADNVVALTVTPPETSTGVLALMAQIRKLYCVPSVRPLIALDVPVIALSLIVVPRAQVAGAVAPA